MKRIFIILLLLPVAWLMPAQRMNYVYDNAGNRIRRVIVLEQPQRAKKEAQTPEYYTETMGDKTIKLYPNPVTTSLTITITGYEKVPEGSYVLFDTQGKVLLNRSLASANFSIDMSEYRAGNYVLRIAIEGETTTWKVIKK